MPTAPGRVRSAAEVYADVNTPNPNAWIYETPIARFLSVPANADATERDFRARELVKSWGVDDPDGSLFSGTGRPAEPGQFYDKVRQVWEKGTASLDTPEATAWKAIPPTDRAARVKVALADEETWSKFSRRAGRFASDTLIGTPLGGGMSDEEKEAAPQDLLPKEGEIIAESQSNEYQHRMSQLGEWLKQYRQQKDEDEVVSAYESKIMSRNWLEHYKIMQPGLLPEADAIVKRAAKSGAGVAEEDFNAFMALPPEQAEKVAFLARSAMPENQKQFWTDLAVTGPKDLISRMWGNLVNVSVDALVGSGMVPDPWVGIAPDKVREIKQRMLLLKETNANKAYGEQWGPGYNAVENAFIGAATTLPYMAVAAIPAIGIPLISVDQFGSVRDRVLREGGNPDEALIAQWVSALAYGYLERLGFETAFGKPLTTIQRRKLFLNLQRAGYKQAIKALGKEAVAVTAAETVQDMTQQFIEGIDIGIVQGDPDMFAKAVEAFVDDARSIGSFAVLGAFGAGTKGYSGHRAALDRESVAEWTITELKANQIFANRAKNMTTIVGKPGDAVQLLQDEARKAWFEAPDISGAVQRLVEIGYTADDAVAIGDAFDLERAALRPNEPSPARYLAETRLTPADAVKALIPGATVEEVGADGKPIAAEQGGVMATPPSATDSTGATSSQAAETTDKGSTPVAADAAAEVAPVLDLETIDAGNVKRSDLQAIADAEGVDTTGLTRRQIVDELLFNRREDIRLAREGIADKGAAEAAAAGERAIAQDVAEAERIAAQVSGVSEKSAASGIAAGERVVAQIRSGDQESVANDQMSFPVDMSGEYVEGMKRSDLQSMADDVGVDTKGMTRRQIFNALKPKYAAMLKARGLRHSVAGDGAGVVSSPASTRRWRVTIPLGTGANKTTKSYTIEVGPAAMDIESKGFAGSVHDAMDGRSGQLRIKEFMDLTKDQKIQYLTNHNLYHRGQFKVLDSAGRRVIGSDGLMSLVGLDNVQTGTKPASNMTLYHEHFHAVVALAKEAGALDVAKLDTMRQVFGAPLVDGEDFNEEAAANAFAKWVAGGAEAEAAKQAGYDGVFGAIREFIEKLLRAFGLMQDPTEVAKRDKVRDAVFSAIRSGDFQGLSVYAGIQIGEDAKPKEATKEAVSPVVSPVTGAGPSVAQTVLSGPQGEAPAQGAESPAGAVPGDAAAAVDAAREAAKPRKAPKRKFRDEMSDLKDEVKRLGALFAGRMAQVGSGAVEYVAPVRVGGPVTVYTPDGSIQMDVVEQWIDLDDMVDSSNPDHQMSVFVDENGQLITAGGNNILNGNGQWEVLKRLEREGRVQAEYVEPMKKLAADRGKQPPPEGMKVPVLARRIVKIQTKDALEHVSELSNGDDSIGGTRHSVTRARSEGFVDPPAVEGVTYGGVQRWNGLMPDQYVMHIDVPGGPTTTFVELDVTAEQLTATRDRIRANFGVRHSVTADQDARFRELTATWTPGGDWQAWKAAHPAEYAELEKMRADVLKAQGYTERLYHGRQDNATVLASPMGAWLTPRRSLAQQYAGKGQTHDLMAALGPVMQYDDYVSALQDKLSEIDGEWTEQQLADYRGYAERYGLESGKDALDSSVRYVMQRNPDQTDVDTFWFLAPEILVEAGRSAVQRDYVYGGGQKTGDIEYVVFDPAQLKSASVTPDDTGRIPPPSEWGNPQSPDIRHSVTAEQDAAYLGDDGKDPLPEVSTPEEDKAWLARNPKSAAILQAMVDEAAKRAGYTVGPVWHGGEDGFTVFDWGKMGAQGTTEGKGFYFSNDKELAQGYAERHGGRNMRVFLRGGKRLDGKKLTFTKAQIRRVLQELHRMSEEQEDGSSFLWNYGDIGYDGLSKVVSEATEDLYKFSEDDVSFLGGLIGSGSDPELTYEAAFKVTGKTGIVEDEAWGRPGHVIQVATSQANVKLADPITRDASGRVIPPSERFNPQSPDIRHSVTAEQDAAYLQAVDAGDLETAQRMVDEAALRMGYGGYYFHGTDAEFTQFDPSKTGSKNPASDLGTLAGHGFSLTPYREVAAQYGKQVMRVFAKADRVIDVKGANPLDTASDEITRRIAKIRASYPDLDGIVLETGFGTQELVVFDPSQIKSADPVTRDDADRVIPPSERFNPKSPDIRHSVTAEQDARFRELTKTWTPGGEDVDEPSSYLYHGTPAANLASIRRNGLQSKTRQRNDWEEGDRGPQEQDILYFEQRENDKWGGKKRVQLRVNEDMLPSGVSITEDGLRPGEFYASHRNNDSFEIPPEAIDYKDAKTGEWIPLVPRESADIPAAWAAWKAAHPAEYAELEQMRAEVLKAQGYGTQTTDKAARDWTERKRQLEQAVSVAENNVTNGEAAILKTSEDTAIGRVMRKATARHKEQLASLRKELEMGQPPTRLYHGSSQSWTVYRRKDGGRSIWASDSAKVSGTYGDNLVPLYFKTDNPLIVDAQGASFRELAFEGKRLDADDIAEIAESRGYDGLIIRNFYDSNTDDGGSVIADHYTVFRPSQVKSADVTPDSTGRIPPPSEWGNPQSPDIRFSVTGEDYRMGHRPNSDGPQAHDLLSTDMAPRDIYERPDFYTGEPGGQGYLESVAALRKIRGKPNADVMVYRASPKKELNFGDWVSFSRAYSAQHGMADDPSADVPVHAFSVKAKDVRWAGDTLEEFGYYPESSTPARNEIVRTSNRNPASYIEALVAARIMAGKKVTPEDVASMVKNTGIDADPNKLLADAAERAKSSAQTVLGAAKLSDRDFLDRLADDIDRERYSSRVLSTFGQGADYAGAGIEAAAKLEKARNEAIRRQIESACGYTAERLETELGIDLSEAVLNTPDVQQTAVGMSAQEKAIARDQKAKRDAEADADLSPEEDADPMPIPAEKLERIRQLQAKSRAMVEAENLEAERKRLERERKQREKGEKKDADAESGSGGDGDGDIVAEEEASRPVYNLIAPEITNGDDFAAFMIVAVSDMLRKDRPDLDPNTMFRNPAAFRDLISTIQNELHKLATDLLGTGRARVQAVKDIADLRDAKTVRRVYRETSYIYSRLHADALRTTRKELVNQLERDMERTAIEPGRFRANREDLKRKVTAKVEKWARKVRSYMRMNAMEMHAESVRLRLILDKGQKEEQETGYLASEDQAYVDAEDNWAVLCEYGGMINWMPGQISDAYAVIMEQLKGARAEWEETRFLLQEKAKEMAGTLADAVSRDPDKLQPEPGKVELYGDSLKGILDLRMEDAIRFAKGKVREKALKFLEDISVMLGNGATDYRMYEMDGNAAMNGMLTEVYGSAQAGLARMDEPIPAEAQALLGRQGPQLTYGRAVQLYGSIIQKFYADNVRRHGRGKDLSVLRSILTAQDLAFHQKVVGWYRDNRKVLSDAQLRLTGVPILSQDQFYIPVVMQIDPYGWGGRHATVSTMPKSLTPRIRNRRDFDESASILDVFQSRLQDNALFVAYGEKAVFLRDVIGSTGFQSALERFHGVAYRKALVGHFEDVLRGGRQVTRSDGFAVPVNVARSWMARTFLAGNLASAAKQVAGVPAWAHVVGFRDFVRYLSNIDPQAIAELKQSREFRERYAGGWSEETNNILSDQKRGRIAKAYDKGLLVNSAMDAVAGLWIAQGMYRDLKAKFADQGYSPEESKSRALTITWNTLHKTQQSARTENLSQFAREGGAVARMILQFSNSPLQQLQFEIQAYRELRAGTEGAKAKFLRTVIINHVFIPAILMGVNAGLKAILGVPPKDDDERRMWITLLVSSISGQWGSLFLVGSMGEAGIRGLMGEKMPFGQTGLPVEASTMLVWRAAALGNTTLKLGLSQLSPNDMLDVTTEDLLTDMQKMAEQLVAPYRHISQAIKNRQE